MVEIVDAHVHIGQCRVFGRDVSSDTVITAMDNFGITTSVVQPYPGAPDAKATHDEIARLSAETGGRAFGLASYNPHRDESEYFEEIRRCAQDLGFVGVKLHTIGHAVDPGSADAATVFSTAIELNIPVMVHTGPGLPFSDPGLLIAPARRFPDLQIILAHAGHGIVTGNAVALAEICENVSLETSWCRPGDIGNMIDRLGSSRVMFGTDSANNVSTELAKYKSLELAPADEAEVMGGTARRLFRLE
jgi:uncharacterized protein